jgi:hypothetical protein
LSKLQSRSFDESRRRQNNLKSRMNADASCNNCYMAS